MPDEAHAKAVEAAAMAVVHQLRRFEVPAVTASAAITAFLATMAEAGWVMARDVGASGDNGSEWGVGWNACRAAMLKGTTDEQG